MSPDPDHSAAAGSASGGGDLMERAVDGVIRLGRAWRALSKERRTAAIASAILWLALFLPWYQDSVLRRGARARNPIPVSESLSGWAAFSAIEGLILIVSLAVPLLLFLRVEGHLRPLPGGDGWTVTVAGMLSLFLIVLGMFSAPAPANHGQYVLSTGLEWGIFVALLAAAGLTWAGGRIRHSVENDPLLARRTAAGAGPGSTPSAPATPTPTAGTRPAAAPGSPSAAPAPARPAPGSPSASSAPVPAPGPAPPVQSLTAAASARAPAASTRPASPAPPADSPPARSEPHRAPAARSEEPDPAPAARSEEPDPAPAARSEEPDAAPTAPLPRSARRRGERAGWSDPDRPVGWLTAPPRHLDDGPGSEHD